MVFMRPELQGAEPGKPAGGQHAAEPGHPRAVHPPGHQARPAGGQRSVSSTALPLFKISVLKDLQ